MPIKDKEMKASWLIEKNDGAMKRLSDKKISTERVRNCEGATRRRGEVK